MAREDGHADAGAGAHRACDLPLQGKEQVHAGAEADQADALAALHPVPLRVEFENDLSGDFTIIDIFTQDEPGLLYRIARALSREGLVIYRARISTEANKAIDAFYVQDRKGKKISSAYRLKKIRDRLIRDIGQETESKKRS